MIIGLSGRAGCGKDAAALYLQRHHGFAVMSFADPIKRALAEMFGGRIGFAEGAEKEKNISSLGKSPRELMQTLGTEWGRELIHPDVWIIALKRQLATKPSTLPVVIKDVRFDNEAKYIKEIGGEIWRIERPGDGVAKEHVSESGLKTVTHDRVIENASTLVCFYATIDSMLKNAGAE